MVRLSKKSIYIIVAVLIAVLAEALALGLYFGLKNDDEPKKAVSR